MGTTPAICIAIPRQEIAAKDGLEGTALEAKDGLEGTTYDVEVPRQELKNRKQRMKWRV